MTNIDFTFVPGEYIVFTHGSMKVERVYEVLKAFHLKQAVMETLTDDPEEFFEWIEALHLVKYLPFRRAAVRNINGKLNPVVFPNGANAAIVEKPYE